MTPAEHNVLALEVATITDKHFADPEQSPSDKWISEFARRYRIALKERMEPVAWVNPNVGNSISGEEKNTRFAYTNCYTIPLYSLEDWT